MQLWCVVLQTVAPSTLRSTVTATVSEPYVRYLEQGILTQELEMQPQPGEVGTESELGTRKLPSIHSRVPRSSGMGMPLPLPLLCRCFSSSTVCVHILRLRRTDCPALAKTNPPTPTREPDLV